MGHLLGPILNNNFQACLLELCTVGLEHQEVQVRVLFHLLRWLLKCPSYIAILQLMELEEKVNITAMKFQCTVKNIQLKLVHTFR